jgi:hypothetical protein
MVSSVYNFMFRPDGTSTIIMLVCVKIVLSWMFHVFIICFLFGFAELVNSVATWNIHYNHPPVCLNFFSVDVSSVTL